MPENHPDDPDPTPTDEPTPTNEQTPTDEPTSIVEPTQAFGDQTPGRFAADVEYSGRAGHHDYLVRVRHRLLDTTFTVVIDGIEHDPKAEEKALAALEDAEEAEEADADGDARADVDPDDEADVGRALDSESDADGDTDPDAALDDGDAALDDGSERDGLRFRLEDGFATLRCTVRRPKEGGIHKDAEVITLRTAGLGGAGEVDIRHGFKHTVLVPTDGSPSAARDAKRTAHPNRYALVAALTKSARYLLPLLGFGALFSGLLDPLIEWIEARARPAIDAIARITAPPREWIAQLWGWIAELTRPIREFLDALFSPIWEFFASLLQPVRDLWDWLLGLLPDFSLPFGVPDWLVDVLVPVIVVVVVFSATREGLRERRKKLEATKAAGVGGSREEEPEEVPDSDGPDSDGPDSDGPGSDVPDSTESLVESLRSPGRAEQDLGEGPTSVQRETSDRRAQEARSSSSSLH